MDTRNAEIICTLIGFCCLSFLTVHLTCHRQVFLLVISAIGLLALLLLIAKESPLAEKPKKKGISSLEASVLDYMNDDNAHYAISLSGEWGSGKTWFCDNTLKPLLKQNQYSLCRISLFGLSNSKEISSKIVAALFAFDETGRSHISKALKRIAPQIALSATKAIKPVSKIPSSLDPVALLSVLPKRNCLIVLDDLERGPLTQNSNELFGIVNELCENQGRKVLLISNSQYGIERKTQLEKVVWRKYQYKPSAEDLYDSILHEPLLNVPNIAIDLDIKPLFIDAIKNSRVFSARAIIKARPSLIVIATSVALQNYDIDKSERGLVLSKAIELSVLVAADGLTEVSETEDEAEKIEASIQQRGYEYLKNELKPIADGETVDKDEIDKALERFIKEKHNRTELDIEVDDALSEFRSIRWMSNDEAASLAAKLSGYIQTSNIKPKDMKDVYQANKTLRDLGFSEAISDETMLDCFIKEIDSNPFLALGALRDKYTIWIEAGEEKIPFLDDLVKRAEKQVEKQLGATSASDNDHDGQKLQTVELLRECIEDGKDCFIPKAFSAKFIASSFKSSDGKSQMDLILFFKYEYTQRAYPFSNGAEDSLRWLKEIIGEIENIKETKQLDEWRRAFFVDTLKKIVGKIDENASSAS